MTYLVGSNEKKAKASMDGGWNFSWGSTHDGDTLYHGNYKIQIKKGGSKSVNYTGVQYKDFIYNTTQKAIYYIPSKL